MARENTGPNSFGGPYSYYVGSSVFIRLLPYLEQQVLASAYNTSLTNWVADNSTVGAAGLSVLWCPSDGLIQGLHVQEQGWGWDGSTQILTYTSYAGCMGNFCKVPINVTSASQHHGRAESGGRSVLLPGLAEHQSSRLAQSDRSLRTRVESDRRPWPRSPTG